MAYRIKTRGTWDDYHKLVETIIEFKKMVVYLDEIRLRYFKFEHEKHEDDTVSV